MLEKLKVLGCLMSLKIRFFNSHLDCFPENLGAVSEEQGKRFHQATKTLRKWKNNPRIGEMLTLCWRKNSEKLTQEKEQHTQLRRQDKKTEQGH
jgi:hypothetical protein